MKEKFNEDRTFIVGCDERDSRPLVKALQDIGKLTLKPVIANPSPCDLCTRVMSSRSQAFKDVAEWFDSFVEIRNTTTPFTVELSKAIDELRQGKLPKRSE